MSSVGTARRNVILVDDSTHSIPRVRIGESVHAVNVVDKARMEELVAAGGGQAALLIAIILKDYTLFGYQGLTTTPAFTALASERPRMSSCALVA